MAPPPCQEASLLEVEERGGTDGEQESEQSPGSSSSGRAFAVLVPAGLLLVGLSAAAGAFGGAGSHSSPLRSTLNGKQDQLWVAVGLVKYGSAADDSCPDDYTRITDLGECRAAMPFIEGGDPNGFMGSEDDSDFPAGCYSCSNRGCGADGSGVWFNKATKGSDHKGARPICQKGFEVRTGETIFVGDSDIDYWASSSKAVPESYNLGIGGATCKDVTKEIDFILERFQPKSVVLVCGENDLGGGTSVAQTFKFWTQVVDKITAAKVPIVQLGTKPEADSKNLHGKYRSYDRKIKAAVAARAGDADKSSLVFVDTYKAFVALGNGDMYYDPDEKPDYLHLGPIGYALWDHWVQKGLSNRLGCVQWNGDTCEKQASFASAIEVSSDHTCPEGSKPLVTEADCRAAIGLVNLGQNTFQDTETEEDWPEGCYYCKNVDGCEDGTWFNHANSVGETTHKAQLYCQSVE